MKKITALIVAVLFWTTPCAGADSSHPRVRLETNYGVIVLELDAEKAPKTVENFLGYVREGFYDGTIFHRVIKGFMIQGGGLTSAMQRKPTGDAVKNEADNGLRNLRGTIAMARTSQPHSATAQFFINTVDNSNLDHRDKSPSGWGYCVFGKVAQGMNVVDAIERLPTTFAAGRRNVPTKPAVIEKAVVEK